MSLTSGERQRSENNGQPPNATDLQHSNSTSGHFLGTVRRSWMLDKPQLATLDGTKQGATEKSTGKPVQNTTHREILPSDKNGASDRVSTSRSAVVDSHTGTLAPVALPLQEATLAQHLNSDNNIFETNHNASVANTTRLAFTTPSASALQTSLSASSQPLSLTHSVSPERHFLPSVQSDANFEQPQNPGCPITNHANSGLQDVTNVVATQSTTHTPRNNTAPVIQHDQFSSLDARRVRHHLGAKTGSTANAPAAVTTSSLEPTHAVAQQALQPSHLISQLITQTTSQLAPQSNPVFDPMQMQILAQTPFHGSACGSRTVAPAQSGYLQILDDKIDAVARQQSFNHVENSRIFWLRLACGCNDFWFLALHQLCCINTFSPGFLSTTLSFSPRQIQGLSLFGDILSDNKKLTSKLLRVFVNFVNPNIGTPDGSTQQWLKMVKEFLNDFASRWDALRVRVFDRGSPPGARELAVELQTIAPVLSHAVFEDYFRRLVPFPGDANHRYTMQHFRSSQALLADRVRRGFPFDQTDHTYHQEVQAFNDKFRNILQQHPPVTTARIPSMRNWSRSTALQPQGVAAHQPANQTVPNLQMPTLHNIVSPVSRPMTFQHQAPQNRSTASAQFRSRMLPPAGHILPITVNPDPKKCALHQAHLREPLLMTEDSSRRPDKDHRFYAALECFVGPPKLINKDTIFESWSINVPSELFDRRVKDRSEDKSALFERPTRTIRNGSLIFHVRCVQHKVGQDVTEGDYTTSATKWPEHIFVSVNDTYLEFRRKAHHGRDLAVDVTHLMQQGNNEVTMSYHVTKKDMDKSYVIALEAINILDQTEALKLPTPLSLETSLNTITRTLQSSSEDDDIVMADEHVSIDLVDPFTACIFDHPARGKDCIHRESFDLLAFFQSRSCRNKDDFVQPDEWKCPLCGKDARPKSLVIDLFLQQVREKLLADGLGDTKAILVRSDGSWEPKAGHAGRVNSPAAAAKKVDSAPTRSSSRTEDVNVAGVSAAQIDGSTFTPTEPTIIILDDD